MAQFDVHENPGKNRDAFPFVVIVQSSLYDDYGRRVVIPLVRKSHLGKISHSRINPTFTIDGIPVVLHPLEMTSVAKEWLGRLVDTLAPHSNLIIDALDELISRAWS